MKQTEVEQEYNDKVNGTVYFNPGDVYNIIDASGNPTQITVVANEQGLIDNGDGTVNVTRDGINVVAMEKKLLFQIKKKVATRYCDFYKKGMSFGTLRKM